VQRTGVVAVRYVAQTAPQSKIVQTPKGPKLVKASAPYEVSLAWVRDNAPTKVLKGTTPQMTANTKLYDGDYDDDNKTELPELITLAQSGVYFHPPIKGDDTPIPQYLVRDDGKVDSSPFSASSLVGMGFFAPDLSMSIASSLGRGGAGAADGNWTAIANDGRRINWGLTVGLTTNDAAVSLFEMNGRSAFAVTLRGQNYPARSWAIPLAADTNLGAPTALPTQKSLGDVPKACDAAMLTDPRASDFVAPWVTGARRPIVIDLDGIAQVMASDGAKVRVSSGGECMLALDAKNTSYSVLVFPDDPGQSVMFRKTGTTLEARQLDCQFTPGPLPSELQNTPGFVVSESR
jgi:hypothetical protein